MQCFVCGGEMRVVTVEPHHAINMQGFEYRTLQCVSCGDTERRLAFEGKRPQPPISASPEALPAPEAPKAKSILSRLVRLRNTRSGQR